MHELPYLQNRILHLERTSETRGQVRLLSYHRVLSYVPNYDKIISEIKSTFNSPLMHCTKFALIRRKITRGNKSIQWHMKRFLSVTLAL